MSLRRQDQTTLSEPTVCPCCGDVYEPEQLGDTNVCDSCFKSDDRSEKAMRETLGPVLLWEAFRWMS